MKNCKNYTEGFRLILATTLKYCLDVLKQRRNSKTVEGSFLTLLVKLLIEIIFDPQSIKDS